jgi:RNA polymerase sigma-70 factor (ECF subfamily)
MKPRLLVSSRNRAESTPPETDASVASTSDLAETSTDVSAALDATVGRFAALMRRIGHSYRLPDDTIDEAIQEVRIRLWRTLATAPDIRRVPATYVYRTTVSAMLDLIRRRRSQREAAIESLEARVTPLPAPTPSPDAGLETSDITRAVADAIGSIPESRRAVVRMYLAGYAREEIAALLAWSEPKTRNLLYRGLEDLRRELTTRGIGVEGRL